MSDSAARTLWRVGIEALDETDIPEYLTITSDAGWCYGGFGGGVIVKTLPDGMGGFKLERVIPWRRVLYYEQEKS